MNQNQSTNKLSLHALTERMTHVTDRNVGKQDIDSESDKSTMLAPLEKKSFDVAMHVDCFHLAKTSFFFKKCIDLVEK